MSKGRGPKSGHIKLLSGNPGKRAIQGITDPLTEMPERPEWMSDKAKAVWDRIMPHLEGRVCVLDRSILELYCEMSALLRKAEEELDRNGLTYTKEKGEIKKNPIATVVANLSRQLLSVSVELGFTPASRGRLGAVPAVPKKSKGFDF